jgi:tetratricopeptide (TPR) repeat protein
MNLEVFAACKQDIKYEMRVNKNYLKAIFLLNQLIEQVFEESTLDDMDQKWYVYYDIAFCYNALSIYDISIEYLQKSLKFTNSKLDANYCKSLWLMANNYYFLGNIETTKKQYHKLCEFYKTNGMITNRIMTLINLTSVDNNMKRLSKVVEAFTNIDEYQLLYNSDIDINTIIEEIIRVSNEIREASSLESNEFFYSLIVKRLCNSKIPLIRKKLLAQKVLVV